MEILYLMVFSSIFLALLFLGLFIYATKRGQFDDGQSPAVRMLFEDKPKENKNTDNE